MSAETIILVHLQQNTPAPLKAILNAIHNSILSLIPFSLVQECVHHTHVYTHTRTRTNKGHRADCLLSTPERLATWLLLTFSRVHYGGCAPVQLLLNTEDMDLSFMPPPLALLCSYSLKPFTSVLACHTTKGHSRCFIYLFFYPPSTNRRSSCLYFRPPRVHFQVTSHQ